MIRASQSLRFNSTRSLQPQCTYHISSDLNAAETPMCFPFNCHWSTSLASPACNVILGKSCFMYYRLCKVPNNASISNAFFRQAQPLGLYEDQLANPSTELPSRDACSRIASTLRPHGLCWPPQTTSSQTEVLLKVEALAST